MIINSDSHSCDNRQKRKTESKLREELFTRMQLRGRILIVGFLFIQLKLSRKCFPLCESKVLRFNRFEIQMDFSATRATRARMRIAQRSDRIRSSKSATTAVLFGSRERKPSEGVRETFQQELQDCNPVPSKTVTKSFFPGTE